MIQAIFCSAWSKSYKTTTNKTKTIQDYLGGSSVHKSTCSRQLGSSLQLGLMRYFHENAFVWCVHSGWICLEWGRCCAATCALYHIVWFFVCALPLTFISQCADNYISSLDVAFVGLGHKIVCTLSVTGGGCTKDSEACFDWISWFSMF